MHLFGFQYVYVLSLYRKKKEIVTTLPIYLQFKNLLIKIN